MTVPVDAALEAAVEERGFLEDEGIRQEYARAVEQLRQKSAATLTSVKEEADEALHGAKSLADEIEARALRTAAKISVEEAQKQFTDAANLSEAAVKYWKGAAVGATILLVIVAAGFMWWPLPSPGAWPVATRCAKR